MGSTLTAPASSDGMAEESERPAPIEAATPFDRSLLWELHHAYFATRGRAAWQTSEIPHTSTSNAAYASQHARLFEALVRDLEVRGELTSETPLVVLECAGGAGIFASNFLWTLHDSDPALLARTRYVFTDYLERSVREAVAATPLARWYRQGHVIPARLDVTRPGELELLDGATLPDKPVFVIANYLCCVLPMKHLAIWGGRDWHELHIAINGISDDPSARDRESFLEAIRKDPTRPHLMNNVDVVWTWEPTVLDQVLPDPVHRRAIEKAVSGFDDATVAWPIRWLDFLRTAPGFMRPGGVVLTSDYGSNRIERIKGRTTGRPQLYGNTLNQSVNIALFEPFAAEVGLHVLRATTDVKSLNSVLTSASPFGPEVRRTFESLYSELGTGDDLLDFWNAALVFREREENHRALRFFIRAAEADRRNPEHRYSIGELYIGLQQPDRAIVHLLMGYDIDVDHAWDFEFQLGRAYAMAGEHETAMTWYERSGTRSPHPTTWTNLAILQMHRGLYAEAYHNLRKALALDPRYALAEQRLGSLKDAVWLDAVRRYEAARK